MRDCIRVQRVIVMNSDFALFFVFLGVLLFFCVYFVLKHYIRYAEVHKMFAHPVARSSHTKSIPTGGGVVFGLLHIIFLMIAICGIDNVIIVESIIKICFGGFLILILGALDDKYFLRARYKLFIQIVVALIMVMLGFQITYITNPFGVPISLNFFSIPMTVLWYLFVMNAINMIDGLDGLAAGIAIITCLVLMIFSYNNRDFFVFLSCAFLVASLLAFLKYNFSPAKLFMGDSGSLFIGFILASLAIAGNEAQFKGLATFTLLVPTTVILIPLGDTIFTVIRRIKNKQHIFTADKEHIHHKLINFGFSQKTVTLICWFITFILGLISLGYMFIGKQAMMLVLFIVGLLMTGLFFYIYKKELFK